MFRAIDSGEAPQLGRILAGSFTPPIVVDPLGKGGGVFDLLGNVVGPSNANRVVELSGDSVNKIVVLDDLASIRQTQGQTAGIPNQEKPLFVMPNVAGRPPSGLYYSSTLFAVTFDNVWASGTNVFNEVPGQPGGTFQTEWPFESPPGTLLLEHYAQIMAPGGASVARIAFGQYQPSSGRVTAAYDYRFPGASNIEETSLGVLSYSVALSAHQWSILGGLTMQLDAVNGLLFGQPASASNHISMGDAAGSFPVFGSMRFNSHAGTNALSLVARDSGSGVLPANSDVLALFYQESTGTVHVGFPSGGGLTRPAVVQITAAALTLNVPSSNTVGAAGAAAATPASPQIYVPVTINGVTYKFAAYNP